MSDRDREPADEEPHADVEAGAIVRARKLRFETKPKAEVKWHGEVEGRLIDAADEEIDSETASMGRRKNLPEEVEPGVTYRNVELRAAAGIRLGGRKPDEKKKD